MTTERCLLGQRGKTAKNAERECELHGNFDVWIMEDGRVFVTDLGFPSEEPKQCLALAINGEVALRLAREKSKQTRSPLQTSQRRCFSCGRSFWVSEHDDTVGGTGKSYFCPTCITGENEESMAKKLGIQQYWCG